MDLEEREHTAMLNRDTVALDRYWADDFIVNTPANKITLSKNELFHLVRIGIFSYTSFDMKIEQIFVKGDVVITMGSETVVPVVNHPKVGQAVNRRFTNIWMKEGSQWKLSARHANEIL